MSVAIVIERGDADDLETVDHGVVGDESDRPVDLVIFGITRVWNQSKDGFGERRVKLVTPDETSLNKQRE